MMKSYRKTLILIGLFFTSLLILVGLELGGVYSGNERRARESLVLPDLINTPESTVYRVSVERGQERLVFERRGQGPGHWQLVEPTDVAAEPARLKTLVQNLKELRRSPESGTFAGESASFGLSPPAATVRLWAGTGQDQAKTSPPTATLDVGKSVHGMRYVRPGGLDVTEVVDAKLLSVLDLPLHEWRQPVVMSLPTFQAVAVKITQAGQVIRAERAPEDQWRLTAPIEVRANGAKIESLLAGLSSLRVVDGPKGFIADNVRDFAPYGLDSPAATVEVTSNQRNEPPLILQIGKPVPGRSDRVYVRQGDQDDVVIVDAKALTEIPRTATALRTQQVTDIQPALATRIEVQTKTQTFSLKRQAGGWMLSSPRIEKADDISVRSFLSRLEALQTSEFLNPDMLKNADLDPPLMTIKIWQATRGRSADGSVAERPVLSLQLGRADALRRTIYGRLPNDSVVLALPDTLAEVLPRNAYSFRDRSILAVKLEQVKRLIVSRPGRTDEVVPSQEGEPNKWRMRRPVDAPADTASVTQALASLASLRAEDFVSDTIGDGKPFGLDRPALEIAWETDKTYRLKIGAVVPRTSTFYAALDDRPYVFTLSNEVVGRFEAEFRDRRVMSFAANRADRVVLRWPNRSLAIKRRIQPPKGQPEWVDEPGSDARGIDLSMTGALVDAMAQLQTPRYTQNEGPIPAYTGLMRPRLVVDVSLGREEPPRILRIGDTIGEMIFAAEGTISSGPVFFLHAKAWDNLIKSGERFDMLPANVFAPAPK
jgi:hypothetical protein